MSLVLALFLSFLPDGVHLGVPEQQTGGVAGIWNCWSGSRNSLGIFLSSPYPTKGLSFTYGSEPPKDTMKPRGFQSQGGCAPFLVSLMSCRERWEILLLSSQIWRHQGKESCMFWGYLRCVPLKQWQLPPELGCSR